MSSEKENTVPGLLYDGYGLEVQGHEHQKNPSIACESVVFLPRDTKFRVRLSNANDHECLVTLGVDDVDIGTFQLHPFTKCDLERPVDRPLGFTFLPEPASPSASGSASTPGKTKLHVPAKKQKSLDKTIVKATFKPEIGGRILQIDVAANHVGRCQRLELRNETTILDLFAEIKKDFGLWTSEARCALIHWSTAEYDSPVEDVLYADMETTVGTFRRRENPVRKMSLVLLETVEIELNATQRFQISTECVTTFGDIINALEERGCEEETDDDPEYFFLSDTERLLCSSRWIKEKTSALQVLHKDETLRQQKVVLIKALTTKPDDCYTIIIRVMDGGNYELQVGSETTIRECRFQLETIGGPWGEGPKWLFGGTLLESGHTLSHYGVGNHAVIDLIPRLSTSGPTMLTKLEMIDPVAVERPVPVNSSALIYKEPDAAKKDDKTKRKITRGGTTLRGKTKQQYIEVDPIDVDERFFSVMTLQIVAKDQEDQLLAEQTAAELVDPEGEKSSQKTKAKSCVIA